MEIARRAGGGCVAISLVAVLSGCSADAMIWGPEGARVIQTTEDLIDEMSDGGPTDLACNETAADFGSPSDWDGLAAGEPEQFVAEYWDEQAPLDPEWSINLENMPTGLTPGSTFPGDVFYKEIDGELCVVDVAWSTLIAEG